MGCANSPLGLALVLFELSYLVRLSTKIPRVQVLLGFWEILVQLGIGIRLLFKGL